MWEQVRKKRIEGMGMLVVYKWTCGLVIKISPVFSPGEICIIFQADFRTTVTFSKSGGDRIHHVWRISTLPKQQKQDFSRGHLHFLLVCVSSSLGKLTLAANVINPCMLKAWLYWRGLSVGAERPFLSLPPPLHSHTPFWHLIGSRWHHRETVCY